MVVEIAWGHEKRFHLSFWDALIVAAADAAGCAHLLTEDLQDGRKLGRVQVVNPFLRSPDSLGDDL